MPQKVLMIVRQVCLWGVLIFIIGIFYIKGFKVQSSVCNSCHDVLMMSFGSDFMGKGRSL